VPTEFELAAPSVTGQNATAAADAKESQSPKRGRRPRVVPPDDFPTEQEFLSYVRETYHKDSQADEKNRQEATLDARFVAGDQWDAPVRQRRDAAAKPTLTINRLPAFVAQLVGNRRLNDIGIKIIPDSGGEKKIAEVRTGLIRNIQKESRAQQAYDKAFEQAVIGGLGNFQVHLDYAHDDVFEQDIRFAMIPDPLAVVWDAGSVEPSGADAQHVFVVDRLSRKDFKKRYPKAEAGTWAYNSKSMSYGWDTEDTVQVVSFWRMRSESREVALLVDGSVVDVTDEDLTDPTVLDTFAVDADGFPMIREVQRKYAEMYLCSSKDLLAGPYRLPIQRVPVFRVPGWELFIEGDRIRWGLIRFLRDPQKLHNYWRSTIAEKLVGSPKAKWVASSAAVEGRENEWRQSHLKDDPLLIYNAESGAPPQRAEPVQLEPALIQEAGMAAQDIRDVSNIHEASLGVQGNEVSGRAIMARQQVGELGTVIYQDNLNIAIEEAGKVINQLIPFVYNGPRIVKILGPDNQTEEQVTINAPGGIDITTGKYSVSVVTGPSYTTRRVEAREEMMAMVNAMPQVMAPAADLIIEAQDWPGSEKIARRMRTQLPPGMIGQEDMDEEMIAQQQAAAQAAQQQQEIAMVQLQLEVEERRAEIELKRVEAAERMAKVEEIRARAAKAAAETAATAAGIDRQDAETTLKVVETLRPQPTSSNGRTNA
jgi:hypothetical protein